jgi:hypothetical protein
MNLLDRPVPPKNVARPNTPEWIYNEIMRFIEPDLLKENIPLLPLKYAGETPEDKAGRMRAYEEAFAAFDAAFTHATLDLAQQAAVLRSRAHAHAMAADKAESATHLRRIESAMDDSAFSV